MSLLRKLLVEPCFRAVYGPPLKDEIPRPPVLVGEAHDSTACGEADSARGTDEARSGVHGLVLCAPGVGGFDLCGTALRYVLGSCGEAIAIHSFLWGHGLGHWYADLTDVANRDGKAAQFSEAVRQFKSWQPDIPVYVIGKSGGAGIVVKALEQLEENLVERAILLAPALSPGYDLTRALRAVAQEMVVFWSPLDIVVLDMGTRVFGTADRVRTPGAGVVGFRVPVLPKRDPTAADLDCARQYAKLRQVKWCPRMVRAGHLGGHFGPDSPIFLKNYVVPLLRKAPARSS